MTEQVIDYRSVVRLLLKLSGIVVMIYGVTQLVAYAPMTALGLITDGNPSDWLLYTSPTLLIIAFGVFRLLQQVRYGGLGVEK